MDFGWLAVCGSVVVGSFYVVVFGVVPFDDSGVAAVSAWRVRSFGYFRDGVAGGFLETVRGKSPLGQLCGDGPSGGCG